MRYIVSHAPQGTPEWHQARLGKLTGSRAKDALGSLYGGKADYRSRYAIELALERITGSSQHELFKSKDIERGIELEPFARMTYEERTGHVVAESGFAYLPTIMAGCSVDGFVGDDGVVEIKCPKPVVHVGYMLAGGLPDEYLPQVRHNLWITGRKWCDFVSYCPSIPGMEFWSVRYEPQHGTLIHHEAEANSFLFTVKDIETTLRERIS